MKRKSKKKITIGSVGLEMRTFCTFKNSLLTQEQTQVDLILARTETNFVLTWEKVISRTRYVLCIGSVGFESGDNVLLT